MTKALAQSGAGAFAYGDRMTYPLPDDPSFTSPFVPDDEQDTVAGWLLDRVDYVENAEVPEYAPSFGTCTDVLRESYFCWCRDNGIAPLPARRWGLRLNELGFGVTARRRWGGYRPLKVRNWWPGHPV